MQMLQRKVRVLLIGEVEPAIPAHDREQLLDLEDTRRELLWVWHRLCCVQNR